MSTLEARLIEGIRAVDVAREPRRLREGATLLEEVQQHEAKHARLAAQIEAFLSGRQGHGHTHESRPLADRAYEVLDDSTGPMHYRAIAGAIVARGFRHAREPKHGEAQLPDSVWTAMHKDPHKRFTKVDRGIWDLSDRVRGAR